MRHDTNMIRKIAFLGLIPMANFPSAGCAQAPQAQTPTVVEKTRAPRYPLKTARGIYTDAEIAQARANVARYPAAKAVADDIVKAADEWLKWSDEDLARLVTPASVPRAFDVSSSLGCPQCGQKIHEKFGTYPWLVDLKKPFKLTCPVDGSVYPTNDYETYLRSGFQEKKGWDTAYVDDGWGWTNAAGEKFWFVAHYNHRVWHYHLGPAVPTLAHAYLLTGDRRYAYKAALLLSRIAAVYPSMDHEKQSRYGLMMAAQGTRYRGKVLNHIWETNLLRGFAEAYDMVWETLDADTELQRSEGKSGRDIRAFIEANLLEDGIDAYYKGKVQGNFGMHQSTLVNLALARQYGERDKWLGGLMNRNDSSTFHTGLNSALYNLVFRDGVPYETGPGYNFIWVSSLSSMAGLMDKAGYDLFALPRMRRLYDGVLDVINIRRFTPALGDSGSVYAGLVGQSTPVFQTAYRRYKDPRYARFLASFGATGDGGFKTFDALFLPPIVAPGEEKKVTMGQKPQPIEMEAQRARLLDGYGMGILNNPADTVSASLYYGLRAGHGHFDRLGFELFARGQSMLPDLGYPDAANAFVAGRYIWSINTIAHNTVTVDAAMQKGNVPGTVRLFTDGPFARTLDVNAPETYPQCSTYARRLTMVDDGAEHSYYVDVFTVRGGRQHDYSLHGPPGQFEPLPGATWSSPAKGTLAGENVVVGEIYDDANLAANGKKKGYGSYTGSGFQHLFNVQKLQNADAPAVVQWAHEKDAKARLRLRLLPQPGQEVRLADARVSPVKFPQIVKYIIARHQNSKASETLASRFVSVIEPFGDAPFITDAQLLPMPGSALAVAVRRANGETDIVLHDEGNATKVLRARDVPRELAPLSHDLTTDARSAVVTFDAQGRATRVFFAAGTYLTTGGQRHVAPASPVGSVVAVAPAQRTLRVRLDNAPASLKIESLAGRVVHFENEWRRTAHPIADARREGDELVLTIADDLRVGRVHLTALKHAALTTDTGLPLAPIYRGVALFDDGDKPLATVRGVEKGSIALTQPLPTRHALQSGQNIWLVNIGPGDRLDVPPVYSWSAAPSTVAGRTASSARKISAK